MSIILSGGTTYFIADNFIRSQDADNVSDGIFGMIATLVIGVIVFAISIGVYGFLFYWILFTLI
jgi:hypothetical protein